MRFCQWRERHIQWLNAALSGSWPRLQVRISELLHGLGGGLQYGEWRSQLVRDIGDEDSSELIFQLE